MGGWEAEPAEAAAAGGEAIMLREGTIEMTQAGGGGSFVGSPTGMARRDRQDDEKHQSKKMQDCIMNQSVRARSFLPLLPNSIHYSLMHHPSQSLNLCTCFGTTKSFQGVLLEDFEAIQITAG